jgi:hypothetical protein
MEENTNHFTHNDGKAVHESGHAVMCVVLNRQLLKVSIEESNDGGGFTDHTPDCSSRQAIVEEVAIMLAGGAAADLWCLITNTDDDERRAWLALQLHIKPTSIDSLLNAIRDCVQKSIKEIKPAIEKFARRLQQEREIEGTVAEGYIKSLLEDSPILGECLAGLL